MISTALKIRISRILTQPWIGRTIARVYDDRIPNRGRVFDTSNTRITPSVKALIYWGMYEGAEVRYVLRYLRTDLDVVELGSSIGIVSSHIAHRLQPSRRLICVEANPHLLPSIRANVSANAPETRFDVVHGAISYTPEALSSTTILLGNDHLTTRVGGDEENAVERVSVPTATLAGLLQTYEIDQYVLVADIEGAEAGLLADDASSLERCQQILIELHDITYQGRQYSVDDMCEILQGYGFSLVTRRGPVLVFNRNA